MPLEQQEHFLFYLQGMPFTLLMEYRAGHWTAALNDKHGRLLFNHTSTDRETASREVVRAALLVANARRN